MRTDFGYLVSVICDGEPSHFLVGIAFGAGITAARLAELAATGHADLAFDLCCESLRKRCRVRPEARLHLEHLAQEYLAREEGP